MVSFTDMNVSQDSVATYARCGGIFNVRLTKNFPKNLPVKTMFKSVKNLQNYGHESVAPFLAHPVYNINNLEEIPIGSPQRGRKMHVR